MTRVRNLYIIITICIFCVIAAIVVNGRLAAQQPKTIVAAETTAQQLVADDTSKNRHYYQPDIAGLTTALNAYVQKQTGSSISLYFQYLPTSQTIAIEPARGYKLMSLAKLPIIVLLMQQVETGTVNLDDQVIIADQDIDGEHGSLWLKGSGSAISLRQAMQVAIQDSDNTAIKLIRRVVISHNPLVQAAGGLDVKNILRVHADGQSTDVRAYSSLLTCLYTACQTNRADAREILSYMSHTRDSAIRDGSGRDSVVADKFGFFDKPGQPHLYNDCGIVYSPNGNYIICIMSQHPTVSTRGQVVDLSRIIYTAVAETD